MRMMAGKFHPVNTMKLKSKVTGKKIFLFLIKTAVSNKHHTESSSHWSLFIINVVYFNSFNSLCDHYVLAFPLTLPLFQASKADAAFPHYSRQCYLMSVSKMEAQKDRKVPAVSVLVPESYRIESYGNINHMNNVSVRERCRKIFIDEQRARSLHSHLTHCK